MSRPVPSPRALRLPSDVTVDNEDVKSSPSPQSPTKSPKHSSVRSTPPPVLPKRWCVKKSPAGSDSGYLEIIKVVEEKADGDLSKSRPPALPQRLPKKQPDNEDKILDDKSLLDWWKTVTSWNSLCRDLKLRGVEETTVIRVKAEQLHKAIRVYILLLSEHVGALRDHTDELLRIADNLDKVSKGTKIAGITGGATTVAGGVAAAAGVILSPFTLGASLALTAVGVGVAAAGGVTGASAAIAHKVNISQDKKKIEKIFQEYESYMKNIEGPLKFINEGMEQLKKHDLSVLNKAREDSRRADSVVKLSVTGGGSAKAIEATSKASGLMQGFALGMDMYFTQDKDGQKVKRGLESKFAKKIRRLAEDLNKALDELVEIKELFSKHC